MEKMKIIGTGLSGLVGSRIREVLANEFNFVNFSLGAGIDILDFSLLEKEFKKHSDVLAVLHLAAFTDTNAAWKQRGDKTGSCYQLNVEGTKNIVRLCRTYGKKLIYFSTDFVFDGKKEGVYTEKDEPNPTGWYGQTKYLGEKEVKRAGVLATILRIAFPFRAKFGIKKDIVRKLIEGFRNKSLYPLFADQIITPTFIDDIALGVGFFLKNDLKGIFHLVGSTPLSPYRMGQEIAEVFGFEQKLARKGSLEEYQRGLPFGSRPWQKSLALSNQKVKSLGIKMKSFRKALLVVKKQMEEKK